MWYLYHCEHADHTLLLNFLICVKINECFSNSSCKLTVDFKQTEHKNVNKQFYMRIGNKTNEILI